MLGTAITISLVIGFLLGFCSYFACRVGYKELIKALNEENEKKPLAYTDQVD